MEVKSYRAPTLQDALKLVQQDLGPEASVLRTKQVWDGLWRGLWGRRQIEVTASNKVQVPSRFGSEKTKLLDNGFDLTQFTKSPPATDVQSLTARDNPHLPGSAATPAPAEPPWGRSDRTTEPSYRDQTKSNLPAAVFRVFTDLVDADVDEAVARELVARLRQDFPKLGDQQQLHAEALKMIEADIAIQGPIKISAGSGRVVALVGPTGVGKTTTIAKLAANFRLREKRRVGLVTVDTYRIAAVEQLRTYADIIDLPMEVVSTAREMREAIRRLSHLDLILMDTAGRSPRDEIKLRELKSILNEAQAHEVHLVLSATHGRSALLKTAERFAKVGTSALLITKLDESTGLGNLLPLWRSCGLPLSYVTNGQNVPDDIQAANARKLAEMLLGHPPSAPSASARTHARPPR